MAVIWIAFGLAMGLFGGSHAEASVTEHALPLDLSSEEYSRLLESAERTPMAVSRELEAVISAGKRNLDWLAHLNRSRPEGQKLSFTSKDTQASYPIERPLEYNGTIVQARFREVADALPPQMREPILNGAPFTSTLPIAEDQYLLWGRRLDSCYQLAARWRLLQPYLSDLARARGRDVRGTAFLAGLADRDRKLRDVNALSANERASVLEALAILCSNSGESVAQCRANLRSALSASPDASGFYRRYVERGTANYRAFFDIPASARRRDVSWVDANTTRIPFADPQDVAKRTFMLNVEDEWRRGPWSLRLAFRPGGPGVPNVTFIPGVTPHVKGLGGDDIVMDANAPLTEYNARWTIRHEFGHVLGFPDCYHEFYDSERATIVSYQIDVTDLMCSRRGSINARLERELRRTY